MKQLFVLSLVLVTSFKNYCQVPHVIDSLNISKMAIDTTFSRPYALIAGGSKGIGYALAEAWAKRNYNLILIARHWDSLETAKHKLESAYNIHVELLSYDLSREESAINIAVWCAERNIPLKVLCNGVVLNSALQQVDFGALSRCSRIDSATMKQVRAEEAYCDSVDNLQWGGHALLPAR